MDPSEARKATLVVSTNVHNTKLPLLVARAGNVGVQIDAFRSMTLFHRPRCGKFTAKFLGITYENHSLENYARMLERTQTRNRILSERLERLQQHEVTLQAEERRRQKRRKERERLEQQRQWILRQTAKKAEQQDREERAARTVQRVVRGHITRRQMHARRDEISHHTAANCLQAKFRGFLRARRRERRKEELEKERRMRAAVTIQRQARKLLRALSTLEEKAVAANGNLALANKKCEPTEVPERTHHNEELSHELSMELLFSSSSKEYIETGSSPMSPHGQNESPTQCALPHRPKAAFKRVGGGFRESSIRSPRLRATPVPTPFAVPHLPRHQRPRHDRAPPRRHHAPRGDVLAKERFATVEDTDAALVDLVELLDERVLTLWNSTLEP